VIAVAVVLSAAMSTGAFLAAPVATPGIGVPGDCGRVCIGGNSEGDNLGAGVTITDPGDGEQVAQHSGSGPHTYTVHTYAMTCSGNGPGVNDNICNGAINCPDPTQTRYWVYDAVVRVVPGQPTAQDPWHLAGTRCLDLGATGGPSLAAIVAQVESDFIRKRPATPVVQVSPATGILVTLNNGFSAGGAAPVQLPPDTVLGLPVVITATPVRWLWDFGDGTTLTTTTPGAPGTTQVSHAWQVTGDRPVRVTVEWSGTFTLGGFTGTFPITGVARVTSAPTVVTVHEARTQLVDQ
jgi:hypothetical protein